MDALNSTIWGGAAGLWELPRAPRPRPAVPRERQLQFPREVAARHGEDRNAATPPVAFRRQMPPLRRPGSGADPLRPCTAPEPSPAAKQPLAALLTLPRHDADGYRSTGPHQEPRHETRAAVVVADTDPPPPQRGFGRLVSSLRRLLPRVDGEGLEDKWAALSEWLDKFHNDPDAAVVSRACEALLGVSGDAAVDGGPLADKQAARRGQPAPEGADSADALRELQGEAKTSDRLPGRYIVAAACVVLDQLLLLAVRAFPVAAAAARTARRVLLAAVYAHAGFNDRAEAMSPSSRRQRGRMVVVPNLAGCRAEALAPAVSSYASRRCWAHVVDVAERKLRRVAKEVEISEARGEKLVLVMENACEIRERQLCGIILRSWRAFVDRMRSAALQEEQHKADVAAAVRMTRDRALAKERLTRATLDSKHREALAHVTQEKQALAEQLETVRAQLRDTRAEKDAAEVREQEQRDRADRLTVRLDALSKELQEMAALMKNTVMQSFEGSEWEVLRQQSMERHAVAMADACGGDSNAACSDALLGWLNAVVLASGRADAERFTVRSFVVGERLLGPYMLVMHYMSPGHVTRKMVDQVLSSDEDVVRASVVLKSAALLDVVLPLTPEELCNPAAVPQQILVVATLFQRFSDVQLSQACGLQPLQVPPSMAVGAEDCLTWPEAAQQQWPLQSHPLWAAAPPPTAASWWRERVHKAQERARLWRAAAAAVHSLCVDVLLSKVQGREGGIVTDQERRQRPLFVDAVVAELKGPSGEGAKSDPLCDVTPKDVAQRASEAEAVRSVLAEHYRVLRRVFLFYATGDSRQGDLELSPEEVWRFLSDAKLTQGKGRDGPGRAQVDDLFRRCNDGGLSKSDPTLNPTEFSRLLLRYAHKYTGRGPVIQRRAPGASPLKLRLSDKLRILLERFVLQNVNYADCTEIRIAVYSERAQLVLNNYRDLILATFRTFARCKPKGWLKSGQTQMGMDDWVEVCDCMSITDQVLGHEAVRQVFLKMQDVDQAQGVGQEALMLTNREFTECLCTIALYKTPAPYLPFHRRLDRFFEVWFLPTFGDSGRFRRVTEELNKLRQAKKRRALAEAAESDGGASPLAGSPRGLLSLMSEGKG
eukprot:TRINITY_DN20554_c0_g1_i1.p1 TRINITY_DN20554_c0_g1~~TRINITY_DN20554_c0_g1_i1.p1  ORF type:complete len:1126 (+),score=339.65 TRINITY_DN20554_c0_g1_i1:45-3380(+)